MASIKRRNFLNYEGNFFGSSIRNFVHRDGCKWEEEMSPSNLMFFGSADEAERLGKRVCSCFEKLGNNH